MDQPGQRSRSPFPGGRTVWFAHIQKTAGTTFGAALRPAVPSSRVFPNEHDEAARARALGVLETVGHEMSALPKSRLRSLWLFAEHLPPALAAVLADRPIFLTLLRDPVRRAISHLAHVKFYGPRYHHMSLLDLLDNRAMRRRLVENFQTRFLSATPQQAVTFPLRPWDAGEGDLASAKEMLESFDAVGLTEQLEETTRLVEAVIGFRPPLPPPQNEAPPALADEMRNPTLFRLVRESVGYDTELYEWARTRFFHQLDQIGASEGGGSPASALGDRAGLASRGPRP